MSIGAVDPRVAVGMRDLARHTRRVIDEVHDDGDDRIITDQGRPVAVLRAYQPQRTQLPVTAFDAMAQAAELAGDHRRYELIQGELSVSPSPNRNHQRAVGRLIRVISAALEQFGWEAQPGNDLRTETSVLCPDAMLVPMADDDVAPTLVIEVTSTNRATDLGPKRDAYSFMGIAMYWVLDRERRALLVYTLDATTGTYPKPDVYGESTEAAVLVPVDEELVKVTVDVAKVLGR
ncbi:prevent-host-death family protein [Kineosphaera limosa]|uniref:Putative restriction endonuclease domain-containing protein n=1 Tax=Kineosphaera limosa NBRC 100340 TaxID=1184609 RepID=K6XB59_9MICO|nr:Uma2 family endonuclease [Kineosphaera limosa]NYE02408.1 prevent-host-death family protein [Kineosphaera limosa]GAB96064.1 hypothetical protein KILIM_031_00360 [Kineosphaera limosa NBRC 100340]